MTDYESRIELTQAEYIELKRESGHGSVPKEEVAE